MQKPGSPAWGDTDLARIELTVNGASQIWQEQLSWVNRAIRPNDEIVVALGPDWRIVGLDTDER